MHWCESGWQSVKSVKLVTEVGAAKPKAAIKKQSKKFTSDYTLVHD